MLVLMRKEGEQVQIGPDICVTVVRIEGGGVRIGITAPEGANILRQELVLEPPAERKQAETAPVRRKS